MTRAIRLTVACFVAVSLAALACASGAFAASPWWHLASFSRPRYLGVRPASLDAQDLTVEGSPGELFVLANLTTKEAKEIIEGKKEPEKFALFEVGESAGAIAAGLEEIYGAGNLEVSGGAGAQAGLEPYVVTFKGALAYQAVSAINTELGVLAGFAGTATVTQLTEGRNSGELVVSATNRGDASMDGASSHITITDDLPAGVQALAVTAVALGRGQPAPAGTCSLESTSAVSCEFDEAITPYDGVEARITVGVERERKAGESESEEATVSGGGAASVAATHMLQFASAPGFGIEDYELSAEEEGGAADTQAGSHPFQLTSTLGLNQTASALPAALLKDLNVKLPAGLIGNPTPFPRCTLAQFHSIDVSTPEAEARCPTQTAVGVATVMVNRIVAASSSKLYRVVVPIFNIEPAEGEPARFGFFIPEGDVPVLLDASVRNGEDYGITVSTTDISQAVAFLSSEVTFWGAPGDARHDDARGYACIADPESPECTPSSEQHPPPLLTLPTACTGPLQSSVEFDSWAQAGKFESLPSDPMPALDGCGRLPFDPSISLTPDDHAASSPTGLTVDVHVPQEDSLNANGLSESDMQDVTVVLPEGLDVNPAVAGGLQVCSEAQIGFRGFKELNAASEPGVETAQFTPSEPSCPAASKIANATIKTPLLANPLKGGIYLAAPQNFAAPPQENPFESLFAAYLAVRDPVSGVLVKLAGSASLNEVSGQITTTIKSTPQAPFEDAEVEVFEGARALLATPAQCGSYAASASFVPWSGNGPVETASPPLQITSGPGGGACPGSLPFAPTLAAGAIDVNAGSLSAQDATISREDGSQDIQAVHLSYPPGVSGLLAGVTLCPEAQANAGTCSPESQIGEALVSVGVGSGPFTVTGGKVYLTEKYAGAPFGLSVVEPAKAGPFDLQEGRPVVVRAKVEVDPTTAALTITSAAGAGGIPKIIDGIPVQIKNVSVTANRPGFTFNPTNCNPMAITGSISSAEGATSQVSVPFRVTNCAALEFEPKLRAYTSGRTSKAHGASLTVKLVYPGGAFGSQANIAKTKVDLPRQLPSRLTTLQKACPAAVFEVDPADCPAASIVGHARVITPVLPVALSGPAYFVSHGDEAFPSLTMVLQGYGVTVDLVSSTFIKDGITSSTFRSTPDVPFSMFELTLPEGKDSALAANADLCKSALAMPTALVGQNGAEIHQSTKIIVTGCPKPKRARARVSKGAHKGVRIIQKH